MKKLLSFIQVAFIIGIIYIIGHVYDRLLHWHLIDLLGFRSPYLSLAILFFIFAIIPLFIFLVYKKKDPENKMLVLLAGFASIIPLHLIIISLYVYTNPHICDVPNTMNPLLIIIYRFIIVSISIGVLSIIIRHYRGRWISIFISLLLVYIFDIIIVQGWIFVWLEYFGWMDLWLNIINR